MSGVDTAELRSSSGRRTRCLSTDIAASLGILILNATGKYLTSIDYQTSIQVDVLQSNGRAPTRRTKVDSAFRFCPAHFDHVGTVKISPDICSLLITDDPRVVGNGPSLHYVDYTARQQDGRTRRRRGELVEGIFGALRCIRHRRR